MKKLFLLASLFIAFSKLESAEAFLEKIENDAEALRLAVEGTVNLSFGQHDRTTYPYNRRKLEEMFGTLGQMFEVFDDADMDQDEPVPLLNINNKHIFDLMIKFGEANQQERANILQRCSADQVAAILRGLNYLDLQTEELRTARAQALQNHQEIDRIAEEVLKNIFEPFFNLMVSDSEQSKKLCQIFFPNKQSEELNKNPYNFYFGSEPFRKLATAYIQNKFRSDLSYAAIGTQNYLKKVVYPRLEDNTFDQVKRTDYQTAMLRVVTSPDTLQIPLTKEPTVSSCYVQRGFDMYTQSATFVPEPTWKKIEDQLPLIAHAKHRGLCLADNLLGGQFFIPSGQLLTTLTWLDLPRNYLSNVPDGISRLTALIFLNLSDNKIKEISPNNLENLGMLQSLNLSGNPLENRLRDDVFTQLPALNVLSLAACKLPKFPDSTKHLQLSGFDGSYNPLEEQLPEDFFNASRDTLEVLDLSSCNQSRLPGNQDTTFQKLERLEMNSNEMKELPAPEAFAEKFPTLKILSVTNNRFNQLNIRDTEEKTKAADKYFELYKAACYQERTARLRKKRVPNLAVNCSVSEPSKTSFKFNTTSCMRD